MGWHPSSGIRGGVVTLNLNPRRCGWSTVRRAIRGGEWETLRNLDGLVALAPSFLSGSLVSFFSPLALPVNAKTEISTLIDRVFKGAGWGGDWTSLFGSSAILLLFSGRDALGEAFTGDEATAKQIKKNIKHLFLRTANCWNICTNHLKRLQQLVVFDGRRLNRKLCPG